ncbi:MAG: nucleoside phosphorylase [Proteobacteria bacterium]|nr:nucleoside phosphorylase [Pseudomonadota bacterium]
MPPILRAKDHRSPSVFTPNALLREARRQKKIVAGPVPEICFLDPDGDIVLHLRRAGCARRHERWACYHTELYAFDQDGIEFGIVGQAVGAAFAVLVAEQLFASGCRLLVSMTSAGQIAAVRPPPYFIIVDRALRDEGTSYHYLPASDYSMADRDLVRLAGGALEGGVTAALIGATWTTDAPFRETAEAIETARAEGILAVEMEAAALYAFAAACRRPVLCFAHVTNQMGLIEGDFEKGAADGAKESLDVLLRVARRWRQGEA